MDRPTPTNKRYLSVPPGWKLVPIEPTQEMLLAGEESYTPTHTGTPIATPSEVYTAMLSAAPQPAPDVPALAKYQPSGCVICTCDHETQCQWCADSGEVEHSITVQESGVAKMVEAYRKQVEWKV